MGRKLNLIGQKFGRLLVVSKSQKTDSSGNLHWDCVCECGNKKIVVGFSLIQGATTSCGCYHKEVITKHNMTRSTTYMAWARMKTRCLCKDFKQYDDYGGRGITVCERWMNFENFYDDMGEKPKGKYQLDRINVNGNYEPGNCRWAIGSVNSHNRRPNKNSTSKYKGVYWVVSEQRWVARCKKEDKAMIKRLKTEKEAAIKYNEFAILLYGKEASLNVIN